MMECLNVEKNKKEIPKFEQKTSGSISWKQKMWAKFFELQKQLSSELSSGIKLNQVTQHSFVLEMSIDPTRLIGGFMNEREMTMALGMADELIWQIKNKRLRIQ